ncbi:hypothetical protein, partial [Acinetobacter baumannii]|uniref:hypothetical protein n=1 Tax=Acinetobacter baumannii TaxID=470 RepID=UPI001C09D194
LKAGEPEVVARTARACLCPDWQRRRRSGSGQPAQAGPAIHQTASDSEVKVKSRSFIGGIIIT